MKQTKLSRVLEKIRTGEEISKRFAPRSDAEANMFARLWEEEQEAQRQDRAKWFHPRPELKDQEVFARYCHYTSEISMGPAAREVLQEEREEALQEEAEKALQEEAEKALQEEAKERARQEKQQD